MATIRELRTVSGRIKRRIEEHGEVVITYRGTPAYVLKLLPKPPIRRAPLPDYRARLLKRQPTPLSPGTTRRFWEEERG